MTVPILDYSLIFATTSDGLIGQGDSLPWDIPEDLRYFRETTKHQTVIMGRKTFESIGRPLPNRTNVVLTQDLLFQSDGVSVCHSIEEVLERFPKGFIIGGVALYERFLPYATHIHRTLVDVPCQGDVYLSSALRHLSESPSFVKSHDSGRIPVADGSIVFQQFRRKNVIA